MVAVHVHSAPYKLLPDTWATVAPTSVSTNSLTTLEHPLDRGEVLAPTPHRKRATLRTETLPNRDTTRLIISDQNDDAKEVREHSNSYCWDTVSTKHGLFCCMEHKQLYPLCSATVTNTCFGLDVRTIVGIRTLMSKD